MKKVSIDVRIDTELKEKFNYYCKERGISASEALRYYIEGIVNHDNNKLICPVKRDNTKVNMLFMQIYQLIQGSEYGSTREEKLLTLLKELEYLY